MPSRIRGRRAGERPGERPRDQPCLRDLRRRYRSNISASTMWRTPAAEAPTASRAAPQSVRPLRRPAMDGSGDCKLAHARDLHSTCLVPHRIRPVRPRLRGWRARRRRRGRRRRSRRPDRVQRWPETQVAASAERPHRWATERERRGAPGAADRWKRSRAPGNARTGRGVRWPAGRRRATARQFRRPRVDPERTGPCGSSSSPR